MKLKVLKLLNPETGEHVIRPRVQFEDGSIAPVLKGLQEESYLPLIQRILKGQITMSDLRKMSHEDHGTYFLVSSFEEIKSIDDLDKNLV